MLKQRVVRHILRFWKRALGVFLAIATTIPFLVIVFNWLGLTIFQSALLILLLVILMVGSVGVLVIAVDDDKRPLALAGYAFISHDEQLDHTNNHYYRVEKIWDLRDNSRNVRIIKRFYGYNTSNSGALDSLTTSGQSKYNLSNETVKAYELEPSDGNGVDWPPLTQRRELSDIDDRLGKHQDWVKLDTDVVSTEAGNKGIYEINLDSEKDKEENFAVEIECSYGSRQLKPEKFLYYTFFQYKRGVQTASCKLILDEEPDNVELVKISNKSDAAVDAGVERYDLSTDAIELSVEPYGDAFQCTYEETDPETAVFVIYMQWDQDDTA